MTLIRFLLVTFISINSIYSFNNFFQENPGASTFNDEKVNLLLQACEKETNYNKKLFMAEKAVKLYAKTKYLALFKAQITLAKMGLFSEAEKNQNTSLVFKLGKEGLSEDPDSFFYLYNIVDYCYQLQIKDKKYLVLSNLYANRVIKLIKNGVINFECDECGTSAKRNTVIQAYMHRAIGNIYLLTDKTDDAILELKNSKELDDSSPDTFYLLGKSLFIKYKLQLKNYYNLSKDLKDGNEGKMYLENLNKIFIESKNSFDKALMLVDGNESFNELITNSKTLREELLRMEEVLKHQTQAAH